MTVLLDGAMPAAVGGAGNDMAQLSVASNALPGLAALPLLFEDWIVLDEVLGDLPAEGAAPDGEPALPGPIDDGDSTGYPMTGDPMLAAMAPPLIPVPMPTAPPAMLPAAAMLLPDAIADASDAASALDALPVAARAKATLPAADGIGIDQAMPDAPPATTGAAIPAASPAIARGTGSVILAGPPTAWREALHTALGERLQLQLGRGAEQATIRLEPAQLGRIEIVVRHSGGHLEVRIAASNGEVLRQLNAVSDSLRSDLAGRQYSQVSVHVSETPRAPAPAPAQAGQSSGPPGADTGGGRRHEQRDARTPGLALDSAGEPGARFSMNAPT